MTHSKLNNEKRVLLSDCGDVTFSIFFKSYNIYLNRLKVKGEVLTDDVNLSTNEDFFQIMKKQFTTITKKFKYKYGVQYSNIFYVKDSPTEFNWRREIYGEYKANRKDTKYKQRSFNLSTIFKRVYAEIYPELVSKFNINIVQIEKAEADDTISVITRLLPINTQVYIISSDTDYLQLLNRRNTFIYSLNGNLINKKLNGKTAEDTLLEKVICGDKTDNIPPFVSDHKLASYYLKNLEELWTDLKNDDNLLDRFNLNRTLIDFEYIPDTIKANIAKSYQKHIVKCV